MIRKITIELLVLFAWLATCSQTKESINVLHSQLANAKDDTSRINAQVALCLLHRLGNTDSSLLYGQHALNLANRIGYIAGQISALGFMTIVTEQQGNLAKSLELGFKSLQLADQYHLYTLGGPAMDGIAEVYILLGDYEKAMTFLRKYISFKDDINNEGLAYAYFDMGVAHAGLNQLDSAIFYEARSIETFNKYSYEEPLVYLTLGDIKLKSGKPADALSNYQKSLQISLKKNERRASTYSYNKIAAFYKGIGQPDSAILYATKGLEESKVIAQKKTIMEAAALLSELYERSDTKKSLRYLKIADAYKDSLFGSGNIQAVQTLAAQEEERKQQIEAARISYQNQLQQYLLLAGIGALFIIAFFLLRNYRKEKKARNVLQSKNQIIEQTLHHLESTQAQLIQSEKMASLGELTAGIAHEIQNPLNFVNNFSEVNSELADELRSELATGNMKLVDEIAGDIKINSQKINEHGRRADAIVKGMLQHSRTSTGQKEPTDINALADEYLRLAYHGLRAKDKSFNVTLQTDFDSIGNINIVPQDIGRVLLNLFNNAFYAVNERRKRETDIYEPAVSLSTHKLDDKIEIVIKDNGGGIAEAIKEKIFQPFFTTKPTGQGTGLGLSLSYDIVKAHGGDIQVEVEAGKGSTFIVGLPLKFV
jgi:signal transduction histidine kinase